MNNNGSIKLLVFGMSINSGIGPLICFKSLLAAYKRSPDIYNFLIYFVLWNIAIELSFQTGISDVTWNYIIRNLNNAIGFELLSTTNLNQPKISSYPNVIVAVT